MTAILSFYAGPGSGKSTSSAYIYSLLKSQSKNVELVREYVKDWAYLGRHPELYDQIYLLGKQSHREAMLFDKVDVAITDSPVWLCAYYAERYCPPLIRLGVESLVQGYYLQAQKDGHKHINVWVNRSKDYLQKGRFQTEEQAKEIDNELRSFLERRGIKTLEVDSSFDSLKELVIKLEL